MQKIASAAAVSILITGAASAADMAVKAPPPIPAPIVSWTGFYIGGNLGAVTSDNNRVVDWTLSGFDPGPILGGSSGWKVIGGVHGGYNFQVSPIWVLGVEGDWDWTSVGRTNVAPLNFLGVPDGISNTAVTDRVRDLASLRGRAGFLIASVLIYGTGGVAWTNQNYTGFLQADGATLIAPYSVSSNKTGWVAGAGIEAMFLGNWLWRAEWLHYNFDGATAVVACAQIGCPGPGFVNYGRTDINTVRAGVSYKFGYGGWGYGGPVVARY
jgi:outer membrane immunogenic protein